MDGEDINRIMRKYFAHFSAQWQWKLIWNKLFSGTCKLKLNPETVYNIARQITLEKSLQIFLPKNQRFKCFHRISTKLVRKK